MSSALELLTGIVTAPGTTLTGLSMAPGNSLTIRNAAIDTDILLLSAWALNNAAGTLRIRSPNLHDNVQGIRFAVVAGEPIPLFPIGSKQKLIAQDTLTAELSGSATAGEIETACLLVYYQDLPGIAARLISLEDLLRRIVHNLTVENTISTGTAGNYSGEEAINAEFDLLKANTDYAIIGYQVSTQCACVRWRAADFGNLGIGGPGAENMKDLTGRWFWLLSEKTGLNLIPVFNSANKAAVLLDVAQDQGGADVTVSTILAELSPE